MAWDTSKAEILESRRELVTSAFLVQNHRAARVWCQGGAGAGPQLSQSIPRSNTEAHFSQVAGCGAAKCRREVWNGRLGQELDGCPLLEASVEILRPRPNRGPQDDSTGRLMPDQDARGRKGLTRSGNDCIFCNNRNDRQNESGKKGAGPGKAKMSVATKNSLTPVAQKFILHWGEMGTRWGIN